MKLIFIHGSGSTGESFYYQTKYFKNAVAVDLPGHPEGELCTSIDSYVEWLHGYITDHEYADAVLAGHSLGGGICLAYALKYPGTLKGLILLGSGSKLRVHPMILDALAQAVDKPEMFEGMVAPSYRLVDPELAETLKQRIFANGPGVMLNDMKACDEFNIMGREKEITLPTLAICGSDDDMTPPKYSHFIADNIPNARVLIIEGGTHLVAAEKPEQVNQAIEDFISSI